MAILQIYTFLSERRFGSTFDNTWIPMVFVAALFVIAFLIIDKQKRIQFVPEALLIESGTGKLLHNGPLFQDRTGWLMLLLYSLVNSLLYYEFITYRKIDTYGYDGLLLYGIIAGTTLLLPVIKWGISAFLLMLINCNEAIQSIITISLTSSFASGMIIMPILFITTYTKLSFFLYVGLSFIAVTFMLSFLRLIFIAFKHERLTNIYYFVYLCILKILPAAAIVSLLAGMI